VVVLAASFNDTVYRQHKLNRLITHPIQLIDAVVSSTGIHYKQQQSVCGSGPAVVGMSQQASSTSMIRCIDLLAFIPLAFCTQRVKYNYNISLRQQTNKP